MTALSTAGGGGGGGGKRCTFSSIKDEALGHGEKPDWITVGRCCVGSCPCAAHMSNQLHLLGYAVSRYLSMTSIMCSMAIV